MAVTFLRSRPVLALLLGAAFAVALAWYLLARPAGLASPGQEIGGTGALQAPAPTPTTTPPAPLSRSMLEADSGGAEPGAGADGPEPTPRPRSNLPRASANAPSGATEERIGQALDSQDPEVAVAAYRMINRCRSVAFSAEDIEHQYDALDQLREMPNLTPESEAQIEQGIAQQDADRRDCLALREREPDLREGTLFERAAEGDPVARFLYAMWRPDDPSSLQNDAQSPLEYEAAALEFTLGNLADGHSLGLLALGISYSWGEYFTPARRSLGSAYLLASSLCSGGIFSESSALEMNAAVRENQVLALRQAGERQIAELGARLYETHCAESLTNTLD